ncbi:MAG: thermonuclease family protein, partial [Alphaproteobacteria bacterium]
MIVHRITILASLALAAITLAMPSTGNDGIGESITGKAEILGTDMIAINQQLIFLFGVDAPEERQPCFDENGKMWNCAVAAGKTLLDLVGDFDVTCMRMAPDWRRRMYGVCTANNKTINEEMIRAGMAMMIREETLDYESAEN